MFLKKVENRYSLLVPFVLLAISFASVSPAVGTIIIADVEVIRTDSSGTANDLGTLIVEDQLMLLVTGEDRVGFQDAAAWQLIAEAIASDATDQLQFAIETVDDGLQLSIKGHDASSFAIIEDHIVI
ncbi:MAG: hypothetical protein AAF560_29170 [Acidobacteriota bacterium]